MHVQKTGGNTVRGMLNGALPDPRNPRGELPKHAHLGGILKAEPGLADYYVFGFVRNPWSRLVSWWSMIQDAKVNAEAGNEGAVERLRTNRFMRVVATSYDTFDEFVLRGPDDLPRLGTPQLRYLATPHRHGRLHRPHREPRRRCRHRLRARRAARGRGGAPGQRQHAARARTRTSTPRRPGAAVADLYAEDVAAFGYTF